jgi:hypothetical protein
MSIFASLHARLARASQRTPPVAPPPTADEQRRDFLLEARSVLQRLGDYDAARELLLESGLAVGDGSRLTTEQQSLFDQTARERLAEEATWPEHTRTREFLETFATLSDNGVLALADFACCGTCAQAEGFELAMEKGARGYVYFHEQDTELAAEGGGLFLGFGTTLEPPLDSPDAGREAHDLACAAIAQEAVDLLDRAGFAPQWEGTVARRIFVDVPWNLPLKNVPEDVRNGAA